MARAGTSMRRMRLERWLPPATFVLLLVLWEMAVRVLGISDFILPPPSAVLRSFWFGIAGGVYPHHALITASEALLGFVIAVVAGIIVGTAVAESPLVERALYPFIVAFQAMPKVALAPLVIIWFGYGIGSKVVLAAVIAFFPILVNTIAGLKDCDSGKIDMMRALAASRWQIFRFVRFPNGLPYIFAGMNVAAAFVVLGSVVGEFLGAREGLGTLILIANGNLDVAQVFAILVMLGSLGFALFIAISAAQRRLLRWAPIGLLQET
jgi:NitT/TauT family transport system permease protein